MKKILTSVGIGNASVDTVLGSESVTPGETIDAEVRVDGGNAEQEVDRIELEVETRYRTEEGTTTRQSVGSLSGTASLSNRTRARSTRRVSKFPTRRR